MKRLLLLLPLLLLSCIDESPSSGSNSGNDTTDSLQTALTVSVVAVPTLGGTVTLSPAKENYEYGETVSISASANEGYRFDGFSNESISDGTFEVLQSMTIAASFTEINSTVITVSTSSELDQAVQTARSNGGNVTILLEDGEYQQGSTYVIDQPNITFRGKSGDRSKVVVKGPSSAHMFLVRESYCTIENMTIGTAPGRANGLVEYHIIQVQGEKDADHFTLRNCRIIDATEQMLKVSTSSSDETASDSGLVENCLFEFTAGKGYWWYTGGIDAHRAHHWIVRGNTFKNIYNPTPADGNTSLTEGAIHFWSNSRGTVVENNTIINCDRGIMFGLGSSGHYDGVIRNNSIEVNTDVGIYLAHAQNTDIYNNTVYLNSSYPNAIEYRFSDCTNNRIKNNLTNGLIRSREGGEAEVESNVTNAESGWFVNSSDGDLHLNQTPLSVVDQGVTIPSITVDIDNEPRSDGAIDIGADEL